MLWCTSEGGLLRICNDGCDFSTISNAITAAHAGDILEVNSGVYPENLLVKKSLTLQGKDTGTGRPIVDAGMNGSALTVLADGVTVKGFNLTNARGSGLNIYAGLRVWANDSILSDNLAFNNENGVLLTYSNNSTLQNNALENNTNGMRIETSHSLIISENKMRDNNYGLLLISSSDNLLRSNVAEHNYFGIKLNDSENNTLIDNQMSKNTYNFGADGRNDVDTGNLVNSRPILYLLNAENKTIDSTTKAGTVYCIDCRNITISGLNLTNNFHGIYMHNTTGSIVENNDLNDSCIGISLIDSSENLLIANRVNWSLVDGIDFVDSDYNRMTSNRLEKNGKGLFMDKSGNNEIRGNILLNGYFGAYLDSVWENSISDNIISRNQYGIRLMDSVMNYVEKNNITYNHVGIIDDGLGNNTLNNTILNNDINETYVAKNTAGGLGGKKYVKIDSYPEGATVIIEIKPMEWMPMEWKTGDEGKYAEFTDAGSYNLELRLEKYKKNNSKIIIPEDKKPDPVFIELEPLS
jgi:parallel beta-helix repeat protein